MTKRDWEIQGDVMGSTFTGRDWREMNTENIEGATQNPGTVQIHIDRELAKEAAEKAAIAEHIALINVG